MSVNLIVKNFRAIEEAKITVDGITVLRGESNAGKSSFAKAIRAAMTNRFTSDCVRHGTDFAEIKVRFDSEGPILSVKRKPEGSPVLTLGDPKLPETMQSWGKLNRDMPNEAIKFLNLGNINVTSDVKYSLNFFSQFQQPLLTEFSQKKIMDVLSASAAVDDLNKVKKVVDARKSENSGAFKAIDAVLTEVKSKSAINEMNIQEFAGLDAVEKLMGKYDTLLAKKTVLENIKEGIRLEIVVTEAIEKAKAIIAIFDKFEIKMKRYDDLSTMWKYFDRQENLQNYILKHSKYLSELANLQDVKEKYQSLKDLQISLASHEASNFNLKYLNNILSPSTRYHESLKKLNEVKLRRADLNVISSNIQVYSSNNTVLESLKSIIENDLCPLCLQPNPHNHAKE